MPLGRHLMICEKLYLIESMRQGQIQDGSYRDHDFHRLNKRMFLYMSNKIKERFCGNFMLLVAKSFKLYEILYMFL